MRKHLFLKNNKLEVVNSGNILLVAYNYDGDGNITSSFDRDLDFNQNLNINNRSYVNSLTRDQRRLINKVPANDSFLYELTEYVIDRNQAYTQTLMERDGAGNLSTLYTYGNQRLNSESYNNLTGLYTYDGRGSVSAVLGGFGDFRATYWYDGLGNVKSQVHGYGVFGSGKKYYGFNAEQYNPVTGNQNLRNRQVNIRRQRFLTEDTYLGNKTDTLSLNRYIYGNDNPLKYKDPSGFMSNVIMTRASKTGPGINDCGGGSNSNYNAGFVSTGIIYSSSTMLYGSCVDTQQVFRDTIIHGFTTTEAYNQALLNQRIDAMIEFTKTQADKKNASGWWERNYEDVQDLLKATSSRIGNWVDNDVYYNDWYYDTEKTGIKVTENRGSWCSVFVTYNMITAGLSDAETNTKIFPTKAEAKALNFQRSKDIKNWYESEGRYHTIEEVNAGTYIPKIGDIFFKKTKSDDLHSGLVTEYNEDKKKISTVDGNTNNSAESNIGYGVFEHKNRDLSNYLGFGDNFYTGGGER